MMRTDMQPLPVATAETLALRALGWIAADEDLAGRFMGQAGLGPDELRQRAGDPEFLGFVLDFLLSEEATLVACCEAIGEEPDRPARARAALPGGDLPHWT